MIKKKEEGTGDIVILISEREIRQMEVESENEQAIYAGGLTLPRADAEVRYFPAGGRAFVYGFTQQYLAETENITSLEKSTVLRNLFDYGATSKLANIQFYVMIAALIITVFLLRN
ncbi:hypothetical protein [Pelotomaculum sp. FP]|uniref:hypothetical protein n=1 Tax=Pelotomaculum sp. FP TaxID=261474 RepID=UPI001FAA9EDE|nr:hypothetical protein [Pelotomaculum sp. FP]